MIVAKPLLSITLSLILLCLGSELGAQDSIRPSDAKERVMDEEGDPENGWGLYVVVAVAVLAGLVLMRNSRR